MEGTIFQGRTAIVTGATSGIGEQVARELANNGAQVVLSGRNLERGSALQQALGERALFVRGDVSQIDANEELVERTVDHFGVPDYLVLSAGYLGIGKLHELTESEWHQTIGTNLNAVFFLLKKALPRMMERGGAIVIIGSIASEHAFPNHPAYNASKGALPVLVKQIALDYGPHIRINLVSPAQVETPLLHSSLKAFDQPGEILRETAQKLPMKRIGQPNDVASAVLYLLSDDASWVTGTNLVVDGGFLSS